MTASLKPQAAPSQRLAWRMIVAILSLTISTALITSGCQIYFAYQSTVSEINHRYYEIEQGSLPSLTTALWTMDDVRIAALLDSLMSVRDIGHLRLQDELGQVREKQKADFVAALSSRSFELYHTEGSERFKVGTLDITMSRSRAEQNLKEIARTTAITTLSILIVSAVMQLLLFHRWISRPLHQVATYMQQMDFNSPSQGLRLERKPGTTPDELDIVVQAIQQMQQRLQYELMQRHLAEQALLKHKDHLELLVEERTRLLEQQTCQLKQQSSELAEQNAELNAYAHTVAHDLKHPLTSLIGFSTLLSQPQIQLQLEQQQSYLLMMKESALKMNDIINSLLQLASIRSEADIRTEVVDMTQCAEEAIKRLGTFAAGRQARIRIEGVLPPAKGHAQWLEEVWVNYVSNAIKYGGSEPVVTIAAQRQGKMIRYWVLDSGPGVIPEKRSELFKAFSNQDTLKPDSHGLGLSIVKRIVTKLQGDVGYEYTGAGSLFWFSLPAA
ncbi:MAG: HAMP domain-containing protein [Gammaproteobacteria bacterium]|nr:HAMP domain-containing protein [Gammaproteobacteria bacterium]MBU2059474.1 HAMP domain-containing protein [Gammaproteobacteria bacterium]MBU2175895.1 HAMP domain-containing protein [Gammaproteobacteria bacterium]MBU2246309.1 HAMP domain-containing protein [Gammaproteobacteria bacterium]MBU2345402.1 HAMP domain-containing protein [Gammaproteobacteria bacterium]